MFKFNILSALELVQSSLLTSLDWGVSECWEMSRSGNVWTMFSEFNKHFGPQSGWQDDTCLCFSILTNFYIAFLPYKQKLGCCSTTFKLTKITFKKQKRNAKACCFPSKENHSALLIYKCVDYFWFRKPRLEDFFDWIIFNNNRSLAKCWRFESGPWVHPPWSSGRSIW